MNCPNCGAEINGNSKICAFCGSQIPASMIKERERFNKTGCPKCGSTNIVFNRETKGEIRDKNGTTIIRATVGLCKDCGYTWYTDESQTQTPKKGSMLWWVLGWIFFFPAPVMILIWRRKNTWDIKLKIAVTVAFWLILLAFGGSG